MSSLTRCLRLLLRLAWHSAYNVPVLYSSEFYLKVFEGGVEATAFSLSCPQRALGAPLLTTLPSGVGGGMVYGCKAKWLSCLCETKEPTQWDNAMKYEHLQTPNLFFLPLSVDYFQQQGRHRVRDIMWRHRTLLMHPLRFFWLQKWWCHRFLCKSELKTQLSQDPVCDVLLSNSLFLHLKVLASYKIGNIKRSR